MSNWYQDVKNFHIAFGQRVGQSPMIPDNIEERDLRMSLLEEEYNEYMEAEQTLDIVGIADALADIVYIACGTAVSYGIPLDKVFEEVHRSNMAKLVNGQPIYRADGKVLKPEGWTAPDVKGILEKESEEIKKRRDLQNAIITL
jgi:predicted HAD superfamily Cof-like phosphohydrolase